MLPASFFPPAQMAEEDSATESTRDRKCHRLSSIPESDRLSSLPYLLLSQILSLLPTNEAVKTSVLSRRWRNLWTHISSLNLEKRTVSIERTKTAFWKFVDRVLLLRCDSNLKKFRLSCDIGCHQSLVKNWICYAKDHFVEHVELRIYGPGVEYIPRLLFNCESLVAVKLNTCCDTIKLPDSINLPKLKTWELFGVQTTSRGAFLFSGCPKIEKLSMETCHLSDCKSLDFSSSCPFLEDLSIKVCRFDGLNNFSVGRALKKLVIDGCLDFKDCEMNISSQNLLCFSYTAEMMKKFSALNISSPFDALVDFDNVKGNDFGKVPYCDGFLFDDDHEYFYGDNPHLYVSPEYEDDDFGNGGGASSDYEDDDFGDGGGVSSEYEDDDFGDGDGDDHFDDGGHNQLDDSTLQNNIDTWVYILKWLKNARSLKLSSAQFFLKSCCLLKMEPIFFPNLKDLKVRTISFNKDLVESIICILKGSPILETLVIEYKKCDNKGECWNEEEFPFVCSLCHLKEVEIRHFEGSETEVKFAKFFIKNAVMLKSMVFITPIVLNPRQEMVKEISQELLGSLQASPRIAILFF